MRPALRTLPKPRARWLLIAGMLATTGLALPHHATYADTAAVNPSLFRLGDSSFPKGSNPTDHRVETNDLLADEGGIVHYGPSFVSEGRQTGYFMASSQVVQSGGASYAASTYYLVSIFDTAQHAESAFTYQDNGYQALQKQGTAVVDSQVVTTVGDPNYAAQFTVTSPSAQTVQSELFFARGPVFVEVWQSYGTQYPDPNGAEASQLQIGTDLDAIASSALLSPARTPEPVTSTATPTTSTAPGQPTGAPPADTPTPDPGAPVPTSTPTTSTSGTTPVEGSVDLTRSGTQPTGPDNSIPGCGSDYYACATATPTVPLVVDNFMVRTEPAGNANAYDFSLPGVHRVAARRPITLALYFALESAPPGTSAVMQFRVQHGYGVRFYHQTPAMPIGTAANTYRFTVTYRPAFSEKETFVARLAIGGQVRQSSFAFQVVPAVKAAKASRTSPSHNHSGGHVNAPRVTVPASAFALPANSLPPGSQVRHSGIEANGAAQRTLVPHLADRSLAAEGRITGYYLDSVEPNGNHAIYTQYLVSMFGTSAQAAAAFGAQHDGYSRLASAHPGHYTSPASHRGLGNEEGFGTSLVSVAGRPFYTREQYFTRGNVLVEVVQSFYVADSKPYGARAKTYFFTIAHTLDQRAQQR